MKNISGNEFLELLYSDHNYANISESEDHSKLTIEFNDLIIDFQKINTKNPIFFKNLIFSGKHLQLLHKEKNRKLTLQIDNCIFNTNINFEGNFDDISFRSNIFNSDNFKIINSTIGLLDFLSDGSNDENAKGNIFTKGNFVIQNCDFNSLFWIKNVYFMENTVIIISVVDFNEYCFFDLVTANKIYFNDCNFIKEFRYFCDYNHCEFTKCDFFDLTSFGGLSNITSSALSLENCNFEKLANFNKYCPHYFKLEDITFRDKVSFQQCTFNVIEIERTIFEKVAWFDDIQINDLNNCNRKTLRAIKRELGNSHNQIDYLRFKAYELNAYKKEKGKNWKDNFILFLNEKSNYFGLDWTKGLVFTTIIGFLFYLLYLCTYAIVMKNTLHFPNSIEVFWVGYLKFLNPFSLFKSPIEDAETYFFPLFFFMIGKIFISYGIFQTVQAFRKFGVNGG